MENYEQKYKKALEKGRKIHRFSSNPTVIKNMEDIFPELKESEDERIRKSLIALVRQSPEVLSKQNQESMIAWLEKQDEQKTAEWSEEDTDRLNSIIGTIGYCKSEWSTDKMSQDIFNSDIDWLKSIKPQPRWKPTEEQLMGMEIAINVLIDNKFYIAANHLKSIYEVIKIF